MKLYHVDYPGVHCQHVTANNRLEVTTIILAWLTYNKHPHIGQMIISEVDPMELDRKGRAHLAELLAANIVGLATYDEVEGWSVYSVFEAPYP